MSTYVAFSGGKDSTALVLRLAEMGEDFTCLFTPTGNELPAVRAHIDAIVARVQRPLVEPPNHSLMFWVAKYGALPNWRQRWCTRQIKIEPCIAFLLEHPGSTLAIGLRADEEAREGLYGSYATYRYPLREWGWGVEEVWSYLDAQGVTVPARTDCALCYGQRLSEWYQLWREHPEEYAKGETIEALTGHTLRSPGRDTWPAPLVELRQRFEAGQVPPGVETQGVLFRYQPCRVCSL